MVSVTKIPSLGRAAVDSTAKTILSDASITLVPDASNQLKHCLGPEEPFLYGLDGYHAQLVDPIEVDPQVSFHVSLLRQMEKSAYLSPALFIMGFLWRHSQLAEHTMFASEDLFLHDIFSK